LDIITYYPKDYTRTKVERIWNSKEYCKGKKLIHYIEDRQDEFIYVKAYINEDKLEIRRTKFLRESKQKFARFYKDLEAYLQVRITNLKRIAI
jgi:hypothetical protein